MTRESTKARCLNFLAMNCDGWLKTRGHEGVKEANENYRVRIILLCEILKLEDSVLNYTSIVKKYRPDLFEQEFYDDVRKYVK